MNKLIPIKGQVQPYQWGGLDFLPSLLNYDNKSRQPQAEYWLGVHPAAPAQAELNAGKIPLSDVLTEQKCQLQFLLKILDVRQMLSIQVHPTKTEAEEGFARENELGIALSAKNRNYKDDNHKPELMVAVSEFWLLHGFRRGNDAAEQLASKPYLQPLLQKLQDSGLRAAFEFALDCDNPTIMQVNDALVADMAQRVAVEDKSQIEFWIQRWLAQNPGALNGLLTLYFMNLVRVEPGQALYQPAGLLHAYLEGQNVELMADSDNVLRAGLTPKHIDVAELLKVCMIAPSDPADYLVKPKLIENKAKRFPTPFEEFELSELHSAEAASMNWHSQGVEIVVCLAGSADIENGQQMLTVKKGDALAILPGAAIKLNFTAPGTQLYKAVNLCVD